MDVPAVVGEMMEARQGNFTPQVHKTGLHPHLEVSIYLVSRATSAPVPQAQATSTGRLDVHLPQHQQDLVLPRVSRTPLRAHRAPS
jgi:hypothetical protein